VFLLSLDAQDGRQQQLIRFSAWWDDADNAILLDELCPPVFQHRDWPVDGATMRPARLLRSMREAKAERQRAGYSPDVQYSHLDTLPDFGPMRVIRSRNATLAVGRELRNCAGGYSRQIERNA
jgi:hypothetical protein